MFLPTQLRASSPSVMKTITTTQPTAAPIAPSPPASSPPTSVAMAPTTAVGVAMRSSSRMSDCMAAAPLV
ncbi:hypothetical protein SMICM304S_01001 [Streptomyces microflavus]